MLEKYSVARRWKKELYGSTRIWKMVFTPPVDEKTFLAVETVIRSLTDEDDNFLIIDLWDSVNDIAIIQACPWHYPVWQVEIQFK